MPKRSRLSKNGTRPHVPRLDALTGIPMMFYAQWYKKDVSPNLSHAAKVKLLKKISDISLERPIHMPDVNFDKKDFPELAPFAHTKKISGLQLYAVMTELFNEINPKMGKKIGKPYPSLNM